MMHRNQSARHLPPLAAPAFHLSIPKSGSGHGILVLHSWWGLNRFFRDLCGRFAGEGFVALAPDLYGGKVATTVQGAKRLRAAATASRKEPVYRFLMRAIHHLSHHEAVTSPQIGVVGFSMGGHWALWLAQRSELPIAATVTFYAARNGDFSRTDSLFLGHFAETDLWVSASAIQRLRKSLKASRREVGFQTYPGTTHWFFEEDRHDAFHAEAADLAWRRTVVFLREALGARDRPSPRAAVRQDGRIAP